MISSLKASFTPSASDCRMPHGPTRFGPIRFCIRPTTLRSNTIENSVITTRNAKTPTTLMQDDPDRLVAEAGQVLVSIGRRSWRSGLPPPADRAARRCGASRTMRAGTARRAWRARAAARDSSAATPRRRASAQSTGAAIAPASVLTVTRSPGATPSSAAVRGTEPRAAAWRCRRGARRRPACARRRQLGPGGQQRLAVGGAGGRWPARPAPPAGGRAAEPQQLGPRRSRWAASSSTSSSSASAFSTRPSDS